MEGEENKEEANNKKDKEEIEVDDSKKRKTRQPAN